MFPSFVKFVLSKVNMTLNSNYEFIEIYPVLFLYKRCLNCVMHLEHEGHFFLTASHCSDIQINSDIQ